LPDDGKVVIIAETRAAAKARLAVPTANPPQ
jgi:hypothetical protein